MNLSNQPRPKSRQVSRLDPVTFGVLRLAERVYLPISYLRSQWLEFRIRKAQKRLAAARNTDTRRMAWHALRELVLQRSDAQVARMERRKGLV